MRYDGQSLTERREYWLERLDTLIDNLHSLGEGYAKAKKTYYVALSKKLIALLDIRSGEVKTNVAKGDEEIAEFRLKKDIALSKKDTCQQAIYQSKIEISTVEDDIKYERAGG